MSEPTEKVGPADLEKMKECLDRIEENLLALKKLGGEMPVVEKNVLAMMSFIHALDLCIDRLAQTSHRLAAWCARPGASLLGTGKPFPKGWRKRLRGRTRI